MHNLLRVTSGCLWLGNVKLVGDEDECVVDETDEFLAKAASLLQVGGPTVWVNAAV